MFVQPYLDLIHIQNKCISSTSPLLNLHWCVSGTTVFTSNVWQVIRKEGSLICKTTFIFVLSTSYCLILHKILYEF